MGTDFAYTNNLANIYSVLFSDNSADLSAASRIEQLINNIAGGVEFCTYSEQFEILYVSDGFTRLTGYTREDIEILHNNCHTNILYMEDRRNAVSDIMEQLKQDGKYLVEYRIICKDGTIIWVMDNGSIITLEDGTQMIQCIITDITRHKLLENELAISEKRFNIVLSKISDICFDYIFETNEIINYPGSAERYDLPDIISGGHESVISSGKIHPRSIEAYRKLYHRILNGESYSSETIVTIDKNGVETVNNISLTVIYDAHKKPILAVGIISDITPSMLLRREQKFAGTTIFGKRLAYEANLTRNIITFYDDVWARAIPGNLLTSLDSTLEFICNQQLHPDSREPFRKTASCAAMRAAFEAGERFISFEYRKLAPSGVYEWFEKDINIVEDEVTGDINVRCYVTNINDKKQNELNMSAEQKFYAAMVSKAFIIYEVNITKSMFESGHDILQRDFPEIKSCSTYPEIISATRDAIIHPDDRTIFFEFFSRRNLLKGFENGVTEASCDYRRLDNNRTFRWVRCTIHLFTDPTTDDLRGYFYITEIDSEKRNELELIYKSQHDSLTGFLNKATVEEQINNVIGSIASKANRHVFFLLDIDRFKQINDNFGHAFGDAVLSQVAQRIRGLFRDDDILGRIGGDEFVVLMRNIQNDSTALIKAQEICEKLRESYSRNGVEIEISASVGIEFTDGSHHSYIDLYNHADAAMYQAKQNGRNQFFLYTPDMNAVHPAKDIRIDDEGGGLYNSVFDDNMLEYVFRILYESDDKNVAINAVLELVSKHFDMSRAFVYERGEDDRIYKTFEWNHVGSPMHDLPHWIDLEDPRFSGHPFRFNIDGTLYVEDTAKFEPFELIKHFSGKVKSFLQFSIMRHSQWSGFIGFDQQDTRRELSEFEVRNCKNVANILGVFITQMRSIEGLEIARRSMLSMIDGLDSYAYVCRADNFELQFINEKTRQIAPTAKVGDHCYKAFWGLNQPCEVCPIKAMLAAKGDDNCTLEMYNHTLDVWVQATASPIKWNALDNACLIDCVDITKYKKGI